MDDRALLDEVVRIAWGAGELILDVYRSSFEVLEKADTTPVTEGDLRSEAHVLSELSALTPRIPAVSEEAFALRKSPGRTPRFWLVDPLDGTKDFVSRNGEFTVNIALVENGEPVLGVVLAPALGLMFGGGPSLGAFAEEGGQRRPIACRRAPADGLTVLASRFHNDREALDDYLLAHRVAKIDYAGSALKFCRIAAGEADLYPRLGRTMEWDTAAGQAVLEAAGGRVTALDGHPLRYGKPQFANPPFVAEGIVH